MLNCALARVTDRLRDYDIWLLTGDSVWQADTRIVRYRKRFNSLKMRGIDFEAIPDRFESVIEQSGKIKFFGGVRLDASILPTASLTMTPKGWFGQWNDDAQLITAIAAIGGVAIQRFGFFDDQQVGLIVIGNPAVLRRIVI